VRNVIDVKCKFDGASSNHSTLFITYESGNKKILPSKEKHNLLKNNMKLDNEHLRINGNTMFKKKVHDFLDSLSERDTEESKQLSSKHILSMFEKHII